MDEGRYQKASSKSRAFLPPKLRLLRPLVPSRIHSPRQNQMVSIQILYYFHIHTVHSMVLCERDHPRTCIPFTWYLPQAVSYLQSIFRGLLSHLRGVFGVKANLWIAGNASGRTTPSSRPGSPDPRPSSSLTNKKIRRSSGVSGAPYTPEMQKKTWDAIPGSGESMNSSVRSSSRMSWNDEDNSLGMAGPKSKNMDISPQKKAWVDGMMNQARQVSYEMKKSSPGEFGELGKAGNTRRVFLKSAKQDD